MSATANRMEAAYTNEPSFGEGEVRYIRRGIPWKAVGLGLLGLAITALLIYLHVKGRF